MEQRSIESFIIGSEPQSVPSHRSDDTGRDETISADPDNLLSQWSYLTVVQIEMSRC